MENLRRKLTFRLGGRPLVLVKGGGESVEHVLMKALLAALYHPYYPDLKVEVRYAGEGRYKPDVLALDAGGRPSLWGECGDVGVEKLRTLLRRYPATHFAFARWDMRAEPIAALIDRALRDLRRHAPIDLLIFPADAARHLADDGSISIAWADIARRSWT